MSVELEEKSAPSRARRRLARGLKPGVKTTEFWSMIGGIGAALAATWTREESSPVKIAALAALACTASVLGGVYIWSRARVKLGAGGKE